MIIFIRCLAKQTKAINYNYFACNFCNQECIEFNKKVKFTTLPTEQTGSFASFHMAGMFSGTHESFPFHSRKSGTILALVTAPWQVRYGSVTAVWNLQDQAPVIFQT